MSGQLLLLSCFVEIPVINANSVDPDQSPHSGVSDLGLHCLPMSLLWDSMHKWVKVPSKLCKRRHSKNIYFLFFKENKSALHVNHLPNR